MGQRLLVADEAEIDAEQRSVRLKGDVEYLDPTLRVTRPGWFVPGRGGLGEFEGAKFELLDRSVRGAAKSASMREAGRIIDLKGVRLHGVPGRPATTGNSLPTRSPSTRKRRSAPGRDVRLDFLGVPIFYMPWISFPVGDQRKSGLLFPTFGSSGKSGTQAGRAVLLQPRAELRRDVDRARLYSTWRARRSGIALPRRKHAQPAEHRIPVPRRGARRRARRRGLASRDALRAAGTRLLSMPRTSAIRTISKTSASASRARASRS